MAGEIARFFVTLGVRGDGEVRRALSETKEGLTGLGRAVGLLEGALAGIGLAVLARQAYQLAEAGAQAERVGASFNELARQAGTSGDAILQALRRASDGTVAETQLMLTANRAMMLGVADTAEEMARLMEVARFRGRAMGLDTTQAFNDIVTGIGRTSPLILDNLGLVLNLEQEYSQFAQSLGKTAKELTEAEKKQALLNAVLREGERQIRAAGGITRDTADDFEELRAATDDLKTSLGKMLADLGVWRTLAKEARGVADNLTKSYGNLEAAATGYGQSLEEVLRPHEKFLALVGPLFDILEAVGKWGGYGGGGGGGGGGGFGDIADAADAARTEVDKLNAAILSTSWAMRTWFGADTPEILLKISWDERDKERMRREQEEQAEAARRVWEDMLAAVSADLRGIMRPTFAFDLAAEMDKIGRHIDTWDEEARRAMDVVQRGMESPWAQRMLEMGFLTPEAIQAQGGDIRAAAAVWIDEFYKGMHPEAIQTKPLADALKGEITKESTWEGIFKEIASSLGMDLDRQKDEVQKAGERAGKVLADGIKQALKDAGFLTYVAEQVAPIVAASLPTTSGHPGVGGGYIE